VLEGQEGRSSSTCKSLVMRITNCPPPSVPHQRTEAALETLEMVRVEDMGIQVHK
jgi:hypothetical protein